MESLKEINRKLGDLYGSTADKPNFRIVWSDDQFELRLTQFTDEGFQLLNPEVRELPKYRQWIQDKFVLERLIEVPVFQENELPSSKLSYEPLYVFETPSGQKVHPNWAAVKWFMEQVGRSQQEAKSYAKYKDKNLSHEERIAEIEEIQRGLYANETPVGDSLMMQTGVSMAGLDGRSKKEN